MARFEKGHKAWNKGLKGYNKGHIVTEETREKIRQSKIGKNNYNWKGGVTPLYKKLRNSQKYKNWRKLVFERDDYACQSCDATKAVLHPHHIKSWAKHPELRFKVCNGLTLCEGCHGKVHGIDFNKTKKLLLCKNCKNKFKVKDGHYNHKFCSKKCGYLFRSKIQSPKKGKKYPHLRRARTGQCPICGKEFRAVNDTYKRKQKYCSKECWKNRGKNY